MTIGRSVSPSHQAVQLRSVRSQSPSSNCKKLFITHSAYRFGLWLRWIAPGAAPDVSPTAYPGESRIPSPADLPARMLSSISAARRDISLGRTSTTVGRNDRKFEIFDWSKQMMERSAGTRRPAAIAAWSTPHAARSFHTITPVISGCSCSRASAACCPPSVERAHGRTTGAKL